MELYQDFDDIQFDKVKSILLVQINDRQRMVFFFPDNVFVSGKERKGEVLEKQDFLSVFWTRFWVQIQRKELLSSFSSMLISWK